MPDPQTGNIGLNIPVTGTDVGTWGVPLNANFSELDLIAGGVTTKPLLNANVALTTTETQSNIIRFTGAIIANIVITLGAMTKSWVFENLTTGNFTVTVQGFPGTGKKIGLPPGSCQGYWDGTDVNFLNLGKVGEFWDYAGSTVPAWVTACTVPPYLNCNGGVFNAVTYPLLNQVLGGNVLPNSFGKLRATMNQGSGNITLAGSGIDGNTNFSVGGAQNVTIARANLPNVDLLTADGVGNVPTASTTTRGVASDANNVAFSAGGSTIPFQSGTITISMGGHIYMNGNVAQTTVNNMSPTYIGGITMIRAM